MDLAGNEYAVSICAKDSGGPYDYELTTRLINLAKENGLTYTVDIFPVLEAILVLLLGQGWTLKEL